MGPDDHRHSGGRAAYGSGRQRCPRRAESLSHVPPGLRALRKKSPMRQPGQKAVTGRVASHTRNRLVPSAGPHALDFPEMFNVQTGNGAWKRRGLRFSFPNFGDSAPNCLNGGWQSPQRRGQLAAQSPQFCLRLLLPLCLEQGVYICSGNGEAGCAAGRIAVTVRPIACAAAGR